MSKTESVEGYVSLITQSNACRTAKRFYRQTPDWDLGLLARDGMSNNLGS
jgi:hypothetical protein